MSMKHAASLACVLLFSRATTSARAFESVAASPGGVASAAAPLDPAAADHAIGQLAPPNALDEIDLSEEAAPEVSFANWQGTGWGAILPPSTLAIDETGGFDVAFHFHAAMMAERDWRASTANSVLASATFGIGSGAYADAFASPARFGQMLREITSVIEKRERNDAKHGGKKLHVRRVTLAAWSAGFAAVSAILAVPDYYALVDSVVLLDGLHATYTNPRLGSAQGEAHVRTASLATFTRFAKDALRGQKTFVLTHSSIVPPGYASSTECVAALLHGVGAAAESVTVNPNKRTSLVMSFDESGLHARGFSGTSQPAHIDHLHMVGTMMKTFVVPERKKREHIGSSDVSLASRTGSEDRHERFSE